MTLKKKEKDARGPRGSKKWRTIARMQQALGVREDWSAAVRQLTAIKNGGDSGARSRGGPRVAGAKEKEKLIGVINGIQVLATPNAHYGPLFLAPISKQCGTA